MIEMNPGDNNQLTSGAMPGQCMPEAEEHSCCIRTHYDLVYQIVLCPLVLVLCPFRITPSAATLLVSAVRLNIISNPDYVSVVIGIQQLCLPL